MDVTNQARCLWDKVVKTSMLGTQYRSVHEYASTSIIIPSEVKKALDDYSGTSSNELHSEFTEPILTVPRNSMRQITLPF